MKGKRLLFRAIWIELDQNSVEIYSNRSVDSFWSEDCQCVLFF